MIKVLDACAIIAYLRDEDGSEIVEEALLNYNCAAHAINACEVYKDCLGRGENASQADEIISELKSIGCLIHEDMDESLWKSAAILKTKGRISIADCFAIALTERLNGTLYTSDHHELDIFAENGFPIKFIR